MNNFNQIGYNPVTINEGSVIMREHSFSHEDLDMLHENDMLMLEAAVADLDNIKITKNSKPEDVKKSIEDASKAAKSAVETATTNSEKMKVLNKLVRIISLIVYMVTTVPGFLMGGEIVGFIIMYANLVGSFVTSAVFANKTAEKVKPDGEDKDGYLVGVEAYAALMQLKQNAESAGGDNKKLVATCDKQMNEIEKSLMAARKRFDLTVKSFGLESSTYYGAGITEKIEAIEDERGVKLRKFKL